MIRSESDAAEALTLKDEWETFVEHVETLIASTDLGKDLAEARNLIGLLEAAIDGFVLDHYEAGAGFETPAYKATKVVGHRRVWNAEKLAKLVPRGIYKNLISIQVVPAKIDEFVRKGKLDLEKIGAAYEETPNKPYVKITRKSDNDGGEDEAEELAAKLA